MSWYRVQIKRCLQLLFVLIMIGSLTAVSEAAKGSPELLELCNEFNALNSGIRDRGISRPEAKEQFSKLIKLIRQEYYASGGGEYPVSDWVFPLRGYGYKSIGGVKGNGYQKGGYDYFDGNRHTGHPSQDIFIKDKKHISLDNLTKEPVSVLSVTGGVVVAEEKVWDSSSLLRGGKYIWIYDPASNALLYYAHNSRLHVEVGDIVKPGDIISEVGRTGLNAYKRRSPSHLHLTYLSIVNGLPKPVNIYKELLKSKLI